MSLKQLIAISGTAFLLFASSNVAYARETPLRDRPAATMADDRDDMDWVGSDSLALLAWQV